MNSLVHTLLDPDQPFTILARKTLKKLGQSLVLPDNGRQVQTLAERAPAGAFDPRAIETLDSEALGYRPSWVTVRFPKYGLDWDISGLRLESRCLAAGRLPWLILINGGSANFYEFFVDPLNRPAVGQFLAQKVNVLLVSIPGNFKYGGWMESFAERRPQYLLDRDLDPAQAQVRNTVFSNRLILTGLEGIITAHTNGDILIVGHSTSGELAYLAKESDKLSDKLKNRFLGWGSGGPAELRKTWEEQQGFREASVAKVSQYPGLWQVRARTAENYLRSGYIGPLNPCRTPGMSDRETAQKWLALEGRRRPNFKQVLQDLEHRGMMELLPKVQAELADVLGRAGAGPKAADVLTHLFSGHRSVLTGWRKMVWVVGKWDQGHWNRRSPCEARELTIANRFRSLNPRAQIRILVPDMPLTHYGHIEAPREVAGCLLAAARWLSR